MLDSLSLKFEELKVSCTTLLEKWNIDELISICAQKENRLSKKRVDKGHMTSTLPVKETVTTDLDSARGLII